MARVLEKCTRATHERAGHGCLMAAAPSVTVRATLSTHGFGTITLAAWLELTGLQMCGLLARTLVNGWSTDAARESRGGSSV
jgi:hypothetical protein